MKWLKRLLQLLGLCKKQNAQLHYMYTKGNSLPEKLNSDEEAVLIEKMMKGDEEAKQTLIERNLRLVVYTAGKFENTGIGTEDLVSIGTIGLIKAINSYNTEKEIKLATYASRCIENEILMQIRKTQKMKREVSLDDPLNTDTDGNELLLCDVLGTDSETVSERVMNEVENKLLKKALFVLTDKERYIISKRFGLGGGEEMTQKEVADQMEISQSYISRLEKKIMDKLNREIMKYSS